MPVETIPLRAISEPQFHDLDYQVMKHAFDVQNSLGRFYEEAVYCDDLARRCRLAGLQVETEVPVHVLHDGFRKTYYVDLIVNDSVMYELKVVKRFEAAHRRQLLNYLFLGKLQHGTLLNFRTKRVESEFVSTTLDEAERHRFMCDRSLWRGEDAASVRLRGFMEALLQDWGVFLESSLYLDALVHFLGGYKQVETRIPVYQGGVKVGEQAIYLLDETSAFVVTAVTHQADYKTHLRSLVANTQLERVQWINLNKHTVEWVTVD